MKRILTLMIALGAFGAINAQTSKEEARRIILGQEKNKNGNTSERSRDVILGRDGDNDQSRRTYPNSYPDSRNSRVDQINREYNAKIYSIRNNPNLSRAEKHRIIKQLEADRKKKIRQVSNYGKNDRNYNKNKKYHKSNNGKHKGWSKGKGNKHRDRDDD